MKQIVSLCVLVFAIHGVQAQYNETIRTARPGKAVGPFTTGMDVFQVQTGLALGGFDIDEADQRAKIKIYTASLRYGVSENIEIRSAFQVRSDEVSTGDVVTGESSGLSFWNVGVRYNFVNGSGYKPSFGFQTDIKLNWVDEAYKADHIAPRVMLIHGQRLSQTFVLLTNWAIEWSGNDNSPRGTYAAKVMFPLAGKWSSFLESYGQVQEKDWDHRFDTGLAYLLNNDFLLDLSGGYGSNDGLVDWFFDAGLSFRIKSREEQ